MRYLLECTEFNGEYEYPFRILVETNLAPDVAADLAARTQIRGEAEFDETDDIYWNGSLGIGIPSMTEIPHDEYLVLSNYIPTIEV